MNFSRPQAENNKLWSQEDSYNPTTSTSRQQIRSNSQERIYDLPPPPDRFSRTVTPLIKEIASFPTPTPISNTNTNNYMPVFGETNTNYHDFDEEGDNFLKDKHKSDQNYLDKLNEVARANSELRVDSAADFNLAKTRRTASTRDHHLTSPFLYSPSTGSIYNGDSSRNASRASNYTSGGRASALRSTPPIPPADKNMEVIVGKGRRGSGVMSATANSTRSNSANALNNKHNSSASNNNSSRNVNGKPPSSSSNGGLSNTSSNNTNNNTNNNASSHVSGFKCVNCNKKYDNSKDLDIHKLYCN